MGDIFFRGVKEMLGTRWPYGRGMPAREVQRGNADHEEKVTVQEEGVEVVAR
jgi:hypothetical protein